MMIVLVYLYFGLPLGFTWCVLSFLKTYPEPGYLRRFIYRRLTRDDRSWVQKCNRWRADGPTPCYMCEGCCCAAKDGEAA